MSDATIASELPGHPARGAHVPVTVPALELAGIAGLAGIIAIHAADLADKVHEVAYLGFGYLALIVASFVAIVLLAVGDRRRGWVLAGMAAAATLVGYVLTRTTGLPGSHDDVGNWGETLAVWAMALELGVVGLSVGALRRPRRRR